MVLEPSCWRHRDQLLLQAAVGQNHKLLMIVLQRREAGAPATRATRNRSLFPTQPSTDVEPSVLELCFDAGGHQGLRFFAA